MLRGKALTLMAGGVRSSDRKRVSGKVVPKSPTQN